jgi:uncharacterized protein (PEP-CTERM system associated)
MSTRPGCRPTPPARTALRLALPALCLGTACVTAAAQGTGGLRVAASLDTVLTYSDSTAAGSGSTGSDFITELRPGISLTSSSGRVRGSLNYALGAIRHSRSENASQIQNTLSAAFTAEMIDNRVFVDANAGVARTAISAYGQQSAPDSLGINNNRTEVANLSLSPYARGRLGDAATYEGRLTASATNARDSIAGDSTNTGGSLTLASARSGALFGWSLNGTRNHAHFRAGGNSSSDRVAATVTARPDPEVQLSLRGGQEANNVLEGQRTRYNNYGGGILWTPSPRTTASIDSDERYFGRSFRIALQHRFARSSFSFNATRDASTSGDPNGVGQPQTLYQLYFNQFASQQPDPTLREQLVLDFLRALGQDPNTIVVGGYLNTGVTLQRREDLAWTYSGLRSTISVQAFASDSRLIGNAGLASADSATRQIGYTGSLSYRLTPTASASLTGSWLRTLSTASQEGNSLKTMALTWSDQLGRRTSIAFSGRYSLFSSPTSPYHETSAVATLGVRF